MFRQYTFRSLKLNVFAYCPQGLHKLSLLTHQLYIFIYCHFPIFSLLLALLSNLLLLLSHFSRVRLCATPQTGAHQAPPSLGFSRQEYWSGLPFPSPMHESEKWKWSHSVVSNSQGPHGLQPTRLLHPWDFLGKSTGVGCHMPGFLTLPFCCIDCCLCFRILSSSVLAASQPSKFISGTTSL